MNLATTSRMRPDEPGRRGVGRWRTVRLLICLLAMTLAVASWSCQSGASQDGEQAAEESDEHSSDNGEWCRGHGVPESHCTKCHPELIEEFKEKGDWCDEHGFPESACPECNPMEPPGSGGDDEPSSNNGEHSASNGEWCDGHGLPESHCTKCHPELEEKFKEKGDWCDEHGFPESACPECNPMEPPGEVASLPGIDEVTEVVLRDPGHERAAGIEVEEARRGSMDVEVSAPTRLEFDRDNYADIRAAVPGIVRDVRGRVGQSVDKGDPLFVLESADVGEAQAKIQAVTEELNTARTNLERQEKLFEKGLASERDVEEARRDFEEVESRLSSLKSKLQLAGSSGQSTTGRYTIRSPIGGTVVRRPAVVGEFASQETSLATVVDTSTMWAMLDVPERDSVGLAPGQRVRLTVGRSGSGGRQYEGEIGWISPEIDARTRTVEVLAEIDNSDGELRANQFGRAEIEVSSDHRGVIVPRSSLQRLEGGTVVFVRLDEGRYEPRVVEVEYRDGDEVQIRGDLEAGESVVTTGAYILKTELSRESIGAGCCEVE